MTPVGPVGFGNMGGPFQNMFPPPSNPQFANMQFVQTPFGMMPFQPGAQGQMQMQPPQMAPMQPGQMNPMQPPQMNPMQGMVIPQIPVQFNQQMSPMNQQIPQMNGQFPQHHFGNF